MILNILEILSLIVDTIIVYEYSITSKDLLKSSGFGGMPIEQQNELQKKSNQASILVWFALCLKIICVSGRHN